MSKDILQIILIVIAAIVGIFFLKGGEFPAAFGGSGPYLSPKFDVSEIKNTKKTNSGKSRSLRRIENKIISPVKNSLNKAKNSVLKDRNTPKNKNDKKNGKIEEKKENKIVNNEESDFKGKVGMYAERVKENIPKKEYLKISIYKNAGDVPINITGWKLKTSIGEDWAIGKGVYLPYSSKVNETSDIILKKNERAYVVSGRSPVGVNFLLNSCTGYFGQFQEFYPNIVKDCISSRDEENLKNAGLNDSCLDYIEHLPSCRIPLSQKPMNLDNNCMDYIEKNINYNACVLSHKNEPDFYKGVWMVYLNREQEIFKAKREKISLYDKEGKLVESISY